MTLKERIENLEQKALDLQKHVEDNKDNLNEQDASKLGDNLSELTTELTSMIREIFKS
jgi:hypothetical protein